MHPARRFLLAALALTTLPAFAENVQLRRAGNATTITFEYITQDDTIIMVKRLDSDAILSYKWDDLDLDWIKKNNPRVWAEREQLLTGGKTEKKMSKKEAEVDPFAQEMAPTDTASLIKNLTVALQEGLKGMPIGTNKIEAVCNEFQLEETQFWVAYENLKKAGKVVGKNDASAKPEGAGEEQPKEQPKEKPGKPQTPKAKAAATKTKARSEANINAEANALKDFEADARPFNAIGYLRMLSEGGIRGKPVWMMLRRAPADREAIRKTLEKYSKSAAELAEKPEARNAKPELLAIKHAIDNCAESVGKVSRDTSAVEARLQTDCRTLLNLVTR